MSASTAVLASAQALRVRLADEETRQPLVGVLVSAIGAEGAMGPAVLSSSDGVATVRVAGAGPHRLLIRRIGFAPVTTDPLTMPAEPGTTMDVVVPAHRITLGTIHVIGNQSCTDRTESPSAGAEAAWTDVRTALEASALTRDQRLVTTAALRFQRDLRR
ncbi:MAG: carboxypeptidase-like regulatory domain-containing protein, partial [Gemmatimonadales bacterium]